ncbi:MAG: Tol-Pal system protein TolB [Betaproteobacteria bacterium]|nr:Tol-Pal system protein TolB [Betaproteobacteria bacterium]
MRNDLGSYKDTAPPLCKGGQGGFSSAVIQRLILILTVAFCSLAHAQLTIDVTTSGGRKIPIAIVAFANEINAPQNLTPVIANNLTGTGLFSLVNATGISPIPTEPSEIDFGVWQGKGAEALVIGAIESRPDGRFEVRFRLFDVAKQMQLVSTVYTASASQLRVTAHKISDEIYEKLLGERGIFSTKIAYVLKRGPRYELQVADADGFNPQTVLSSLEPIRSPKWSPDGGKLAYVSFESRKSTVVVQDLATGQRKTVANFRGDNYAPNWSPDGSRLVVALSKDSVSQIYLVSATGGEAVRVVESNSIDTNATFTPDGGSIIFVSDRSGGPQLYSVPATGGTPKRLTFEGSYNVNPRMSPDGKLVAFVNREAGKLRIATLELATGQVSVLTDGPLDDSPSFAPNGRTILYESKAGGRGTLGSVSVDGRVKQRLSSQVGDVREPSWGPYGSTNTR